MNLDRIPGVSSVRRIRRTIHSEIAENKFRLDHLGQDAAVLLEALTTLQSEVAALSFAIEKTKRSGDADEAFGVRLQRLEDVVRDFGERLLAAVATHDQQSLGRLSGVRRELISMGQSWEWSEHRPPDGSWIVDDLCMYLTPLLHASTAIEVAVPARACAQGLRDRGIEVIGVDWREPSGGESSDGVPPRIDRLRAESGWDDQVGLVRLPSVTSPGELIDSFGPTRCEVLIADRFGTEPEGAGLVEAGSSLGLRRWIVLLRRGDEVTFTVNAVSIPPSTPATFVFLRDRDTFIAAVEWCSRNVAREPRQ